MPALTQIQEASVGPISRSLLADILDHMTCDWVGVRVQTDGSLLITDNGNDNDPED